MVDLITLPDLPEELPAGDNLESDAMFGEMERAAQGKAESQYGNTIEAATPPDWKETAALAEALLGRTRDLRVMVPLAVAKLHLEGLPGYAGMLTVIRMHVETRWEHIHPQLDPEDDNDPLQRSNALLLLQDPGRVLRPMRDSPLAVTPRTGPVSWRDIAILNGAVEAEPGREKLTEAVIRAAFAGTDRERFVALCTAVDGLLGDLAAVPAAFDIHSTSGSGPDFSNLIKLVKEIQKDLARYADLNAAAEEDEAGTEGGADGTAAAAHSAGDDAGRSGRGFASIQSIAALNSRADALHALELAAAYYRGNEPSSPLPLLIDRALRLAPLPFLDILADMAPDGMMQARMVVGKNDD